MDATGLHALEQVRRRFEQQGVRLLLSGVRAQPMMAMTRSGFLDRFGEDNVAGSFAQAAVRAWELVDGAAEVPDSEPAATPS